MFKETALWLSQMTYKERLREISLILMDYDGYSEASDLMGLIDEVYEYTIFPTARETSSLIECIDFWTNECPSVIYYLDNFVKEDIQEHESVVESFLSRDYNMIKNWCIKNGYNFDVIYHHTKDIPIPIIDVEISIPEMNQKVYIIDVYNKYTKDRVMKVFRLYGREYCIKEVELNFGRPILSSIEEDDESINFYLYDTLNEAEKYVEQIKNIERG